MLEIDVRGPDGNVFAIMGYVRQMLKAAMRSEDDIKAVMDDMSSADYDHALEVATRETHGSITFVGRALTQPTE